MLDLGPIKARYEVATAGPWYTESKGVDKDGPTKGFRIDQMICGVARGQLVYADPPGGIAPEANRKFIAHARADIPNLITEIERLRRALSEFPVPLRNTTIDGIHVAEFRWIKSTVVYVDHKLTEDVYDHAVEKLKARVDE